MARGIQPGKTKWALRLTIIAYALALPLAVRSVPVSAAGILGGLLVVAGTICQGLVGGLVAAFWAGGTIAVEAIRLGTAAGLPVPAATIASGIGMYAVIAVGLGMTLDAIRHQRDKLAATQLRLAAAEQRAGVAWGQLISIFAGIGELIYVVDPASYEVLYANNAVAERLGVDPVGGKCYEQLHGRATPCAQCTLATPGANPEREHQWEFYSAKLDRHFMMTDRLIEWTDGRSARFAFAVDITERINAEREIRHMSFHDGLTSLHNRAYFEQEFARLWDARALPISVIMGDLNGLKLVNDALGHEAGDRLLQAAGSVLRGAVRTGDLVARWGGDEFGIVLPGAGKAEASLVCLRIQDACTALGAAPMPLSISVGHATAEDATDLPGSLLRAAETAMYHAKSALSPKARDGMIDALLNLLPPDEGPAHRESVGSLCMSIAAALGLSDDEFSRLGLLAKHHDIGLCAPGAHHHCEVGERIAMAHPEMVTVAPLILAHEEHWDGSGAPKGLAGREIPLLARILAVAHAWDALLHVTAPASTVDAVLAGRTELRDMSGNQLDPSLVDTLLKTVPEFALRAV